jgi:SAM-dependent methyltransferase
MGSAIAFFDAIAHRYDRDYVLDAATTRARMQRLLGEISIDGADVLDLGVGTGRELPALLDAGMRVTGLDASERMLAQCAKRARPVPLVRADFYAPLPFADASFDAVLALHGTLAHPPDDASLRRLFQEVSRVLRPSGLLAAEVPSAGWLAQVAGGALDDGTRAATQVGPDRIRHEDRASRAAIEAVVRSEASWRSLLEPAFVVSVDALSPVEDLLIARRER